MRRLLLLLSLPLLGQGPRFTVRDAIQAEWARQPLAWTEAQKAALPPADRARLERTLQRIGAPGSPALLPPELEKPTLEVWETKAKEARTPQERFTALFMLNRLKSAKALTALDGLTATDAATWPKHLHLEASLAAARLNGADISPALQAFLDARQKAGKVDPVRAQAARLRLVMAGKESELLPGIENTPGALLSVLDAFNRATKTVNPSSFQQSVLKDAVGFRFTRLGVKFDPSVHNKRPLPPIPTPSSKFERVPGWPFWNPNWYSFGPLQRLLEGIQVGDQSGWIQVAFGVVLEPKYPAIVQSAAIEAIGRSKSPEGPGILRAAEITESGMASPGTILHALRAIGTEGADQFKARHLVHARDSELSACIEDFTEVPDRETLRWLNSITATDTQFEAQQTLIQSYARWKLTPDEQKAQLRPWLQHPDWACRWEAYQALVKLDPATPWPSVPKPTKTDEAILKEASRLAERGKPVRLRITFAGKRSVTLKLDPAVAPMNVANLVLLARKGYFNGRLVPRVVPDFVVQMGSPYDTMDGGPGYTVRCENSLTWYGPGSVGMALSGKDTGGSQFFITTNATPHLTGKYTRMGEVEDLDRAMKLLDDLELGAKIESIKVLGP